MPPGEDASQPSAPQASGAQPSTAQGPTEQGSAAMVCATCGAVPTDEGLARLTWARGVENGRDVWTCETCSRRHLRSIEGKLDSSWW